MLGVIEGFYGRQWPWDWRLRYARQLAEWGYSHYVYAPKGDPFLRSRWREAWPGAQRDRLAQLSSACRQSGLGFGLGLSPIDLERGFGAVERENLGRKLDEIAALEPSLLCVLFDDMRGDEPQLAQLQCRVLQWIADRRPADALIFCPTYYSDDPVLEQVFGAMPRGYLEQIGSGIPPEVGVFWTGPQVCSRAYREADFSAPASLLRRKPALWDNYPVNDGRHISRFLHLAPIEGRPVQLPAWTSAHFANPMNQPGLSALPLWMLARRHHGDLRPAQVLWRSGLQQLYSPGLAALLERDALCFHRSGLDGMSSAHKLKLVREYTALGDEVALEVVDWLQERYRFDPACLTG